MPQDVTKLFHQFADLVKEDSHAGFHGELGDRYASLCIFLVKEADDKNEDETAIELINDAMNTLENYPVVYRNKILNMLLTDYKPKSEQIFEHVQNVRNNLAVV